jgi:signal peptidase I
MENNLLIGDHLLVNKFVFAPTTGGAERAVLPMRDIRRGDIVVFKYPDEPERDFIKRVIGLPGDTITCRGGQLIRNGKPVKELYLDPGTQTDGCTRTTVAPGQLFVMGDNRDNSQDSRVFGPIRESDVVGRAFVRIWPLNHTGWLRRDR